MGDKTFIKITNKHIYDKIEAMEKANTIEHTEIAKHLVNTNGKVKLNRWLGTTALSLCFILLTAVITICVKVL